MTHQKDLPRDLYRAEQVRALDSCAINEFGIPGFQLMRRAGQFAFDQLMLRWPDAKRLSVWCGAGNNGGDGYIVAGLAQQRGLLVRLVQVGDEQKLTGDAALACQWAHGCGVSFTPYQDVVTVDGDVVVDALLGTGLESAIRAPFDQAITAINNSQVPVLSLDVPSGICSDTGCMLGAAVQAELTATFIGLKQGLFADKGSVCCGDIVFDDLAVPAGVYERQEPAAVRLDSDVLEGVFTPRPRDAHKGNFGHVLIVGGNQGMGGAAIMAAQAAGRVGAGIVSVATRPEHVTALLARSPEVMAHGVAGGDELRALLVGKTVVVIGPGLGQDDWARELLAVVLEASVPLLVDADALNLIAIADDRRRDNWIMTPHPGEAARLLQCSTAEIQADRFAAVRGLQARYGGVVLLKGVGSLVAGDAAGPIVLCDGGNPGMASGGMGDVLSGIVGGLLAQGFGLERVMHVGMLLHVEAADRAAQAGERGMQATDLLPHLRDLVNPKK
ncbi:MAG: NAD(P)H-hydrate dehydratase [Pseudomonadales bacterium]